MRSSMDCTSPNQDSKLDHNQHQSTNTNTTTVTATVAPTHLQTLGAPNVGYPNPDPVSAVAVTWYRECRKNHAAASGGYVLDGCGEFMPSGNADENSPASLKCAACECHQSFHRRETESGHNRHHMVNESQLNLRGGGGNNTGSSVLLPHQYLNHHHQARHRYQQPVMMMAFGGAESSSDDLNSPDQAGRLLLPVSSAAKKRFRTKFNQEQKEKMTELAERLGWRIQKHDEQEVQRFCDQVGVKRQVLKVWMHNNKQTMKKKEDEQRQQQ